MEIILYHNKKLLKTFPLRSEKMFFPQLVLAFGNYMNQGNARIAGASAFRVGFLAKVGSMIVAGT